MSERGCLVGFASWVATVAGVLLGGLYCGEAVALWLVAWALLAVGPITIGVAVYAGSKLHAVIRAALAVAATAALFALCFALTIAVSLDHCPLF